MITTMMILILMIMMVMVMMYDDDDGDDATSMVMMMMICHFLPSLRTTVIVLTLLCFESFQRDVALGPWLRSGTHCYKSKW